MKYRASIDGLRALAVLPVILFHAGYEIFEGGFVGVDIFFVISGYLITTILLEDMASERFSIANFYERRARRILPALYLVLLSSTVYAIFFTSPFYARDIFQSVAATTIFAENLLLLYESSNYFDLGTDEKLLFHTWSLAVEEQFYLLFPIFLILFWRFGKSWLLVGVFVTAVFSFTLSEWGWRNQPSANFYLVVTRAWELLSGSIAALIIWKSGVKKNNVLALIGLIAIISSIFAYGVKTPFPSAYALVPVIGTLLLVLYGESTTLAAKLLSSRVCVSVGLISYSAYLWHQPVIIFLDRELHDLNFLKNDLVYGATILFLTLFLAALSYHLIEKPFRYRIAKATFINIFSVLTISLLSISLLGHYTSGYLDFKLNRLASIPSLYIDHFEHRKALNKQARKSLANENTPVALVLGDSMAGDFSAALATQGVYVEVFGLDGLCFDGLVEAEVGCGVKFQDLMTKASQFDYVFISSDFIKEGSLTPAVKLYRALGDAEVFLVNGFRFEHASDLSYRFATGEEKYSKQAVYDSLREEVHIFNDELSKFENLKVIDKYSFFCDDESRECLLYTADGEPLRYDELHMTVRGLELYGANLTAVLCGVSDIFCQR